MRNQRKQREWTQEEKDTVVRLRQDENKKWPYIARELKDTVQNTIALYRRTVGAKHTSYKNIMYSGNSAMTTELANPKIAVIDIETLPGVGFFWQLYDTTIAIEQVIEDISFLGWAGKILNSPTMHSDILTPGEARNRDASRITKSVWDFLSQADVVVGHNFAGYDIKVLNLCFLEYGLPPLKPTIIDTLMVAKQNFRFSSNKLAFINKKLGMRDKLDTGGFTLWKKCHEGEPEALQKMRDYNIGDIYSTEDLFFKFRPYIRNLNVALYSEDMGVVCPVCGDSRIHPEGYFYTSAGKWPAVRCENCGCLTRTKINLLLPEKKRRLLINS